MSRAVEVIRSQASTIISHNIEVPVVSAKEMICGGSADVLLDYVAATPENQAVFCPWSKMLGAGEKGVPYHPCHDHG